MEILNDFRNELLKRREMQFKMPHSQNPGFENSVKSIAQKLKIAEENIAIKYLKNNFGANEFLIEAFVYDSLEHKTRIEPKPKIKKKAVEGA